MSRLNNERAENWENNSSQIPAHEIFSVCNNLVESQLELIFNRTRIEQDLENLEHDELTELTANLLESQSSIDAVWDMVRQ